MNGLDSDVYHGQVVGKISFINKLLERIDPNQQFIQIRDDFKSVTQWNKKRFEEIFTASQKEQCDRLDTLSRKSLVLQELDRFITLLQPHSVQNSMITSLYQSLHTESNLWSSIYHSKLDELEGLKDAAKSMQAPKKHYFTVMLSSLLQHFSIHGISNNDAIADKQLEIALALRDINPKDTDAQYKTFVEFTNTLASDYSFEHLATDDEQHDLIQSIVTHLSHQLTNATLRNKLSVLENTKVAGKDFFAAIRTIFADAEQLKNLQHHHLDSHWLSAAEIDNIYAHAAMDAEDSALERTNSECDIRLLCKAIPGLESDIQSFFKDTSKLTLNELLNPEFMNSVILAEVVKTIVNDSDSVLDKKAASQLCKALISGSNNPATQANLNSIYQYLHKNINEVIAQLPKRKRQLTSLGFGVTTFTEIEDAFRKLNLNEDNDVLPVFNQFYLEIQAAKAKHLCAAGSTYADAIKQIEDISPDDVKGFFEQCYAAGHVALEQLTMNQSFFSVVLDILKAVVNWGLRLLSLGTKPQFFKPATTDVDIVLKAVDTLKENMDKNLEHLDDAVENASSYHL